MLGNPQTQSLGPMVHFLFTFFAYLAFAPTSLAVNVANVLIYSYTAGYRHDSIPTAVESMTSLGPSYGINFVNTEDPAKITDDYLSAFDALFFLSTTDTVLTSTGEAAVQSYLDKGGNFIAVHSASQCQNGWETMVNVIGAAFAYHPDFTNATMVVAEAHPSTAGLPERWDVTDEIYNFDRDPRVTVNAVVVLTADQSSYNDPGASETGQGDPHPISWYQESNKGTNSTPAGRSWYTGLGHASAAWQDEVFLSHIFGGVTWALASNTTRATNPDASVGSDGPEWVPPIQDPEPTGTDGSSEEGSSSSIHANIMMGVLSMTLAGLFAFLL